MLGQTAVLKFICFVADTGRYLCSFLCTLDSLKDDTNILTAHIDYYKQNERLYWSPELDNSVAVNNLL